MKTAKTIAIDQPSKLDDYWKQVHAYARPKAEALGISENDVNRLIDEYRREKAAANKSK